MNPFSRADYFTVEEQIARPSDGPAQVTAGKLMRLGAFRLIEGESKMRENPKYRERNRYVDDACALKDGLASMRQFIPSRYPKWFIAELEDNIRKADKLIYPLIEYRNEVPPEIED